MSDIKLKTPHEIAMDSYSPREVLRISRRFSVPHPIPYQGSKRNLAPVILDYFPEEFDKLIEPFAGSAAVSLATAYEGLALKFILNDAHKPLMDLWNEIINHPYKLADEYENLWNEQLGNEREFYDLVRIQFNKNHQPAHFLYLLARCVKAAIRYNKLGEFNNSPDNRRKGAVPSTMRDRIVGASKLLSKRTTLSSKDYLDILEHANQKDLIYLDPPYQGVGQNRDTRYSPKVDHRNFCEALSELNRKQCCYIVSYDGRTDSKIYGPPLPNSLKLIHLEIHAGRSTQSTLLGRTGDTYESLYLSPALAQLIQDKRLKEQPMLQRSLFDDE